MKIFISWSGKLSHQFASVVNEWILCIAPISKTFLSSSDIEPGKRWSKEIAKELEYCEAGIICVTNENLNSPWINFEAGALSKQIDRAAVIPILLNISTNELQKSPLSQFQTISANKEGFKRLTKLIFKAGNLSENRMDKIFDKWWPEINSKLSKLDLTIKSESEEDKYNHLLASFNKVQQDFTNQIGHVNDILKKLTANDVSPIGETTLFIDHFKGHWISIGIQSVYYGKIIDSKLYIPYLYDGDKERMGHIFNLKLNGNILYGRFCWFNHTIKGYLFLELIDEETLRGGWWYSDEIQVQNEEEDLNINTDNMYRITLKKVFNLSDEPEWAKKYEDEKLFDIYRF